MPDSPRPAPASLKLLAVGNSFSANATRYLPALASAGGVDLTIARAEIGGCSLQQHCLHVDWHAHDAGDLRGRPFTAVDGSGPASLADLLAAQPWDVVTIQQYSLLSYRPDSYEPWAARLCDHIRRHAPAARIVVHQTWAYQEDDPLFADGALSQQAMFEGLAGAYAALAARQGAAVLPVGQAFQNARRRPEWTYRRDEHYDFARPAWPVLPRQQGLLTVGHYWKDGPDGPQLALDGHHANTAGEYLGAAVWYEGLFGRSVVGLDFAPAGLEAAQAASLGRIAHQTCR